MEKSIALKEPYDIDYRTVSPDGKSIKWIRASGRCFYDTSGKPIRFDGITIDITDRVKAENAHNQIAAQLEQQMRVVETVMSSITDFAYTLDRDGRFIYANKPLLDLWGLKLQDAVGKNFVDLNYPPDLAEKLQKQVRQVFDSKTALLDETPYRSPAGTLGYYEYILSPVLDPSGSVSLVAGSTRDITARKLAAERERRAASEAIAIAEANAKFRAFFEQGSYFAGILALDGTVIEANKVFLQGCGFTREQVVGKKFWDCGWWNRSPALVELVRAGCAKAAAGETLRRESSYYVAEGTERFVDLTLAPVTDEAGRVLLVASTGVDITERNELLEAERSARVQAEHASRLKDEFLATLSHELRTPLNAIMGWSQILGTSDCDPHDLEEGLQTIQRNARAQAQIIDDLLDMSRIISGKVRLDIKPVNFKAAVGSAIATVRPVADAKGVELISFDSSPGDLFINGDASRLQQVLWNLLSNAVKFTPPAGKIHVNLQQKDASVQFNVTDSGEGIRPEFLPYIFDRFRQADASITRRHGGLGLGLSIVKQLVELHGGSIQASSPGTGQGSTFSVTIPLAGPIAFAESPPSTVRSAGLALKLKDRRVEWNALRILIVDDEPDSRMVVKRILEERRAVVSTAGSAEEAVNALTRGRFDLLISDIGMPNEDGYALVRRLRSLGCGNSGIPAIALTAYAREEDRKQALSAGFQRHLTKPVEAVQLLEVVAGLTAK
jgi:PAS domain S-box-containing protein